MGEIGVFERGATVDQTAYALLSDLLRIAREREWTGARSSPRSRPGSLPRGRAPARGAEEVVVFAAASLTDALAEIARGFEAPTGHRVVSSFGGSNDLARQIRAGAPGRRLRLGERRADGRAREGRTGARGGPRRPALEPARGRRPARLDGRGPRGRRTSPRPDGSPSPTRGGAGRHLRAGVAREARPLGPPARAGRAHARRARRARRGRLRERATPVSSTGPTPRSRAACGSPSRCPPTRRRASSTRRRCCARARPGGSRLLRAPALARGAGRLRAARLRSCSRRGRRDGRARTCGIVVFTLQMAAAATAARARARRRRRLPARPLPRPGARRPRDAALAAARAAADRRRPRSCSSCSAATARSAPGSPRTASRSSSPGRRSCSRRP